MEELYKKILSKPKAYRRRLAYIITAIFGIIIFSLWMFMTIDNFKDTVGEVDLGENLKKDLPSLKEKYQEEAKQQEIKQELENLGY